MRSCFHEYMRRRKKKDRKVAAISDFMRNLEPKEKEERLLSVLLYAAPNWSETLNKPHRRIEIKIYWKAVLEVC